MTQGREVTIAGKRYESTAAYIQTILGELRSVAMQRDPEPVEVTVDPGADLGDEEIRSLR